MTKSSHKGSAFERAFCKDLSRWWTDGERDDVFWRTSGSGARATARTGQSTFGQYGDIQATDPIGQPLVNLVTFELKAGYRDATASDQLDILAAMTAREFVSFIRQAQESSDESGAPYWAVVHKRTRREPLITIPMELVRDLKRIGGPSLVGIRHLTLKCDDLWVAQMRFNDFRESYHPADFIQLQEARSL